MRKGAMIAAAAALAASSVLTVAGPSGTAEIKVLGTNGFRAVMLALVPQFERSTEHTVTISFEASNVRVDRIKRGETADLVILTSGSLEEVTKLGKVVPGSRVDLARSGVGVAVKAGTPKPGISSVDGLKRALLAAKSVAYSSSASGIYVANLLQRLGIADEVKAKTRLVSGEPVGVVLVRGEAEIGFQQLSALLPVQGTDFVGPLLAEVQNMTLFSAGLFSGAQQPDAAKQLMQFLAAPAGVAVSTQKDMEPR